MRKHEILIVVLTIFVGVEDKILTRVSKSVSIVRRVRGKISEHTSSTEHVSTRKSFNNLIRKDERNKSQTWVEYTTPKDRTILRENIQGGNLFKFPRKNGGGGQASSPAEINYINLRKNFNSNKARQYFSTTPGMGVMVLSFIYLLNEQVPLSRKGASMKRCPV